jgi:phosphoglycerate kinase
MAKQTIHDLELKGKRVLVRVDFNVPLSNGVVKDDNRIVQALPTIQYLLDQKAQVVVFSHLGKVDHKDPEKTAADKAKNNMAPVAARLAELISAPVHFVDATRGDVFEKAVAALKPAEVLVVQNTRYEKGESKNDPELADYWASFGDAFVSDAFGSVHRAHASTVGLAERLPSALGFLVEKEVRMLSRAVENPERPFVAIIGGAKVSDKIGVIENLLNVADTVIIAGGMAYTFLKAQGLEIGTSLCEDDKLDLARDLMSRAQGKLILPEDFMVAADFAENVDHFVADKTAIPKNYMGLDIGPKTQAKFAKALESAKTVVWNGPMGVFEMPTYALGTIALAKAISSLPGAYTVIGGGDSARAAIENGFGDKFSHISTGGGASLEFMEGKVLPGIAAIGDKHA